MGLALETVDFALAATASSGYQTLAAVSPGSAAIRATNGTTNAHLIDAGAFVTTQAVVSITSPRLHDLSQGILLNSRGAEADDVWPDGAQQLLYSQDSLIVRANFLAAPGAASIQHVVLNVFYDDLPGVAAQLRSWAEVQPNVLEYVGIQVAPSSAASPAGWGAGVAINSTYDTLKANQPYAILGYIAPAAVAAVAVFGPDTGNLYCGLPNSSLVWDTRLGFKNTSDESGYPTIPVINSANKANTLVAVASSVASTQYTVTLIGCRLSA